MITPRTKPSSFFPDEAADDLFVVQQRKAKLGGGYVQKLARLRWNCSGAGRVQGCKAGFWKCPT